MTGKTNTRKEQKLNIDNNRECIHPFLPVRKNTNNKKTTKTENRKTNKKGRKKVEKERPAERKKRNNHGRKEREKKKKKGTGGGEVSQERTLIAERYLFAGNISSLTVT